MTLEVLNIRLKYLINKGTGLQLRTSMKTQEMRHIFMGSTKSMPKPFGNSLTNLGNLNPQQMYDQLQYFVYF